jgi:hypothetical protein
VSRDRVGNVTRFRLSRASPTTAWDNTVGVCDRFDTRLRRRRARQLPQLAAASRSFCSGPRSHRWRASRRPRELRLAVSNAAGTEPAIEGGSGARALRTAPAAVASGPLSRSGCTRSARSRRRARSSTVSSTASASRCAASTRWRRSTRASAARSATRSCRAHAPRSATCSTRGCGATRATFSPTASCLPTAARFWCRGAQHTRSRSTLSGNCSSEAAEALASSGSSDDGGDLLRAAAAQAARGRRVARARLPAQGHPVRDDAGGDRHG